MHNLWFFQEFMQRARQAIADNRWDAFKSDAAPALGKDLAPPTGS
jgi:queuine/archaeosine tRNA-ribosyltransferase